jgi:HEAT repeat protein
MGFYDLSKEERAKLIEKIRENIEKDLQNGIHENILKYASDSDTFIRKNTYLILGRLYRDRLDLRLGILDILQNLFKNSDEKVRQTVIYALGEIGKIEADKIMRMLEVALNDEHHSVRNAVIGALKQMGEKNPKPTLKFARKFLHHPDPKIRREIIHGVELRGRSHPEDVLPLLEDLQDDKDRRVIETIIHVLAQISYKEGCLEKVLSALKGWNNKELVKKALKEILAVHRRYEKFSAKSYNKAKEYVEHEFKI